MPRSESKLILQNHKIKNLTSKSKIAPQNQKYHLNPQKPTKSDVVFDVFCLYVFDVCFSCWGMSLAKHLCVCYVGKQKVMRCLMCFGEKRCFVFLNVILQKSTSLFKIQRIFYRKLAKLFNATRTPSNYALFSAKVGKLTCFSFSYSLYNIAIRQWMWLVPASSCIIYTWYMFNSCVM